MRLPLLGLTVAMTLAIAGEAVAQAIKPRIPPGLDPGGVAVAVIGDGIAYTLPQLAQRLARDGEGDLIGWDFADDDPRPLERTPDGNGGSSSTTIASIILREAAATRLVAVRGKPGDLLAHAKAAVLVARSPAKVALLLHASGARDEWEAFRQAALHFSHVLFVVPAGDDGKDIDQSPKFPAGLGLSNIIVVSGTDATGGPLQRVNRGARTIDVAVVADAIDAHDASGAARKLAGSAAGAARVAALAARLLTVEPGLAGAALKARIIALARPLPGRGTPSTARAGWIPDIERIASPR